jgi:hypothetical protein
MTFFKNRRARLEASLFIIVSALVYLPNVFNFTFYRDDWYYIYDGIVLGPRAFLAMFEHLRPLRGPLFAGLFALFGPNPLPYHLFLFVWRVIGRTSVRARTGLRCSSRSIPASCGGWAVSNTSRWF